MNMVNYICLRNLLDDNEFNLEHIIDYYISYISVFYCVDVDLDDELQSKIDDLQQCINIKMKRKDDVNV